MDTFWFYSLDLSPRKFIKRIKYNKQYILNMNAHSENKYFVIIAIFVNILYA